MNSPRRGIHLPHTQNARIVSPFEYEALGIIQPGSVSLLDYQLTGDPALEGWLRRRAADGLEVYTRVFTSGVPDPAALAWQINELARQFPFVTGWLPSNEQNIEGWADWQHVDTWNSDLWWNVDWYRKSARWGSTPIKLLYPPFAPGSPWGAGYDECRQSIELYLSNGDGFAWHDYWAAGDMYSSEETKLPEWLTSLLAQVPAAGLIHECGRRPGEPHDSEGTAQECITRYPAYGATAAHAVTPWLLASRDPTFDGQAWVDETGGIRQAALTWGAFGPR